MNTPSLGFICLKVVAIGVTDAPRAHRFYAETLGLTPAYEGGELVGYDLGGTILMLKDDGSLTPSAHPNFRLTAQVENAPRTEALLKERGVTIADPVATYDQDFLVGSFLDSEGNKLWFCSEKAPT
jgi:catechol 2,3-dioxygenase-like lactoylglutathione lyase family enzyme